jgi:hypothetical protein
MSTSSTDYQGRDGVAVEKSGAERKDGPFTDGVLRIGGYGKPQAAPE